MPVTLSTFAVMKLRLVLEALPESGQSHTAM